MLTLTQRVMAPADPEYTLHGLIVYTDADR